MAFQVGDKVWSPSYGDGVVAHIEGTLQVTPVRVHFVNRADERKVLWFTEDGRRSPQDVGRSLFHYGTHIVEALEPDRKTKKQQFKPFDKVLVRDSDVGRWGIEFYQGYESFGCAPVWCLTGVWRYCIPYEGNEHLLGTTDSPKGEQYGIPSWR
jgi:hypothetical protein